MNFFLYRVLNCSLCVQSDKCIPWEKSIQSAVIPTRFFLRVVRSDTRSAA